MSEGTAETDTSMIYIDEVWIELILRSIIAQIDKPKVWSEFGEWDGQGS